MSQSDYIKYKRVATELKNTKEVLPVFESQDYTEYKEFSLENNITNTKTLYNQLIPPGKKIIFDMEKTTNSCPTFIICQNTNQRPNRVPMSKVYFTPIPIPSYVKQPYYSKTACNCVLNSVNTERYVCHCKTSFYNNN